MNFASQHAMLSMFQNVGSSCVEADGFTVKMAEIPGQGPQQVVLVRKAPAGEYDLEISTSLDSIIKESTPGDLTFREGQHEDKHKAMSSKILERLTWRGIRRPTAMSPAHPHRQHQRASLV